MKTVIDREEGHVHLPVYWVIESRRSCDILLLDKRFQVWTPNWRHLWRFQLPCCRVALLHSEKCVLCYSAHHHWYKKWWMKCENVTSNSTNNVSWNDHSSRLCERIEKMVVKSETQFFRFIQLKKKVFSEKFSSIDILFAQQAAEKLISSLDT